MTIEQLYNLFLVHPQIETDSRKIAKGCLFFALKGEKFNGNRFAAEALKKGAVYAIIDEEEFHQPAKTILVKDVLKTLQNLASYHRKKLGIPVLAITGTNGKTTTKELIFAVLSAKYNITCTQGNLNNHIGVPLTLLQMDRETEMGVIEMGANHPGEIRALCNIADPDYGIITNIGLAHLEGFGSFEAVKATKAELYVHVKQKNGTIFYNSNDLILKELTDNYQNKVSYGREHAGLTGEPVLSPPFIHIKVYFPKGVLYLNTQLTGGFNFDNVMAAACIGNFFEVDPLAIRNSIKNYQPRNNRSQLIEKNGLKIVMDAYNANPTSMLASIESFALNFSSPRFLILGDMLELGSHSLKEHTNILEQTKKHHFDAVFLVGPLFSEAAKNFTFQTFFDSGELCRFLAQNPVSRGAILVKGSRGMQLEKVFTVL